MSERFHKNFFEHLCDYKDNWRTLFVLTTPMLVLSALSLAFVESGTATHVVTVVNVIGLTALAGLSGFFVWKC